nr:alpha-L-arabinofuranosidase C-terminal domain-containing protein [Haloferula luteola]
MPPDWFWENLGRWDHDDRNGAKVYLGEWAAHDQGRRSTLRAALSEAAYFTSMERNGDVVVMASYAPLLARTQNTHWSPDLVYFNNTQVLPTLSYQVQKLLGNASGDRYLATNWPRTLGRFSASTVKNSRSGEIFVKLVHGDQRPITIDIDIQGIPAGTTITQVDKTELSGPDLDHVNTGVAGTPDEILPVVETLQMTPPFQLELAPYSFTVLRLLTAQN